MKKIIVLICFGTIVITSSAQNVGINSVTPVGKLHIKGSDDTSQLVIDAHSTQSNLRPLVRLRNSSGNDLMWIHSDHPTNSFLGWNAGRVNTIGNPLGLYNTFVGSSAGQFNSTGYHNTANGYQALYLNISGRGNTAIGGGALYSNTTGHFNTAVGVYALSVNNGVSYNTAIGYNALTTNSTGYDNTATGAWALYSNRTASENTAFGKSALETQSYNPGSAWASGNVAVGNYALYANQPTSTLNGINNTAMGSSAMRSNSTGASNSANGYQALFTNSTGSNNTAHGANALYYNVAGSNATGIGFNAMYNANNTSTPFLNYNVAVGYQALQGSGNPVLNIGNYNTVIGSKSLFNNRSGEQNTASGYQALFGNTIGWGNTANGHEALSINIAGNYNTAIGDHALYFIDGHKNIAIGAYSGPSSTLYGNIENSVTVGYNQPNNLSNQAVIGNTLTQYVGGYVGWTTYISDGRFKKNVQDNVKGLDFILQLRPVTYNLDIHGLNKILGVNDLIKKSNKSLTKNAGTELKLAEINNAFEKSIMQKENITYSGFIAQEVEQAAKKVEYNFSGVKKPQNENDNYGIAYSDFVVPLVKAVQEQQQIIVALQKQVDTGKEEMQSLIRKQQNSIEDMKKEIAELKKLIMANPVLQ